MGKSPDDLPLDDRPFREPADIRDAPWFRFSEELTLLIESGEFTWAAETLLGIRDTVEQFRAVTSGQRLAVEHIRSARVRADGWRHRRYEGFTRERR